MNPILDEYGYYQDGGLSAILAQARGSEFSIVMKNDADAILAKEEKDVLLTNVQLNDNFGRKVL